MYKVPHTKGVVSTAANFVKHVSELIERESAAAGRRELAGVR
jgi:hypothetical protein